MMEEPQEEIMPEEPPQEEAPKGLMARV